MAAVLPARTEEESRGQHQLTVTGRPGADPRQGTTKAGKPWASFTLAADDSCRTWTEDAPGHRARGQVELKAYDVALSLRFAGGVGVRAPRGEAAAAGTDAGSPDP